MPSELEQKLLRLALDPGAQPGEIQAAAIKLVEFWRKKGLSMEDILGPPNQVAAPQYYAPDYGLCVMPFGWNKGKQFKDISPGDLEKTLAWIRDNESKAQRFRSIAHQIEQFLNQ